MSLLILFLILAAIFGVGGVIKGVLWLALIGAVLLVFALFSAFQALGSGSRRT